MRGYFELKRDVCYVTCDRKGATVGGTVRALDYSYIFVDQAMF